MEKNKRPYLKAGLIFSNLIYILLAIIFLVNIIQKQADTSTWVLLFYSLFMFGFNVYLLQYVESSKLIFQSKKLFIWISILLGLFYSVYLFVIFWYTRNILVLSLMFILIASFILYIIGMYTKVNEGKITYDEHLEAQKTKK